MFNIDIKTLIIDVLITLVALSGHEMAHGLVSYKLGDPTPKRDGRLTMNPLAHLDPIGTIMMVFFHFGWAKPVMVNPAYYRDRKKGMALVAFAGPAANLVMAMASMLLLGAMIVISAHVRIPEAVSSVIIYALQLFAIRNIGLAVFNLIPFPPLDGSRILGLIIPDRYYYKLMQYERYSMILLMILCVTGVFSGIIGRGAYAVYNVMLKLVTLVFGKFV